MDFRQHERWQEVADNWIAFHGTEGLDPLQGRRWNAIRSTLQAAGPLPEWKEVSEAKQRGRHWAWDSLIDIANRDLSEEERKDKAILHGPGRCCRDCDRLMTNLRERIRQELPQRTFLEQFGGSRSLAYCWLHRMCDTTPKCNEEVIITWQNRRLPLTKEGIRYQVACRVTWKRKRVIVELLDVNVPTSLKWSRVRLTLHVPEAGDKAAGGETHRIWLSPHRPVAEMRWSWIPKSHWLVEGNLHIEGEPRPWMTRVAAATNEVMLRARREGPRKP